MPKGLEDEVARDFCRRVFADLLSRPEYATRGALGGRSGSSWA